MTQETITVSDAHGRRNRIRADKWEISRDPDDKGTLTLSSGEHVAAVFQPGCWTGFVADRFAADGNGGSDAHA